MYECFHCGCRTVVWDSDFTFNERGYDGYGIVHFLHCANCGAEIEYAVAIRDDNDEDEDY